MRSRSPVRAVVAASLAFALVSAAAAGTAFSVNSVQGFAVASAAVGSFDVSPCTGSFDITWSVSSGEIVGVKATRVPPSTISDPGLMFCADMPYAVLVGDAAAVRDGQGAFDFSAAGWTVEWQGTTDVAGSIDASSVAPVSGSLSLAVGTAVQLAIGPDPLNVTSDDSTDSSGDGGAGGGPPPSAVARCAPLADGGLVVEIVEVGSDEFCVHTFMFDGTFRVNSAPLDVDYLVVGGGGGGGGTLGGGGGGGAVVTTLGGAPLQLAAGNQAVVVGEGGAGGTGGAGADGEKSSFGSIEAAGGGGGGNRDEAGREGGSGGGGGGGSTPGAGGDGDFTDGGAGATGRAGGGGGGFAAGIAGAADSNPGDGGDGRTFVGFTFGELIVAAGGGGGSEGVDPGRGGSGAFATTGVRVGGRGSDVCVTSAPAGLANGQFNTGSGGGGGGFQLGSPPEDCRGGNGGSGIVIVRYRAP